MMLAKKYELTPIGTMAHEFIMAGQALEGVTLAGSQKYMLQAWVDEYRGDLGTALTDTLGVDKFLRDFDLYFSKLYDGVRHDSGDPFEWGYKMIEHYKAMKIDPKTKSFVWSDGLDFPRAAQLYDAFKNLAKCSFGIGTNLTNDFPEDVFPNKEKIHPLNIVMKIVSAGGKPVAKLSDDPGKGMCEDESFLSYLKKVISE
jgi:nicotinate phosphoribosyltransferase